MVRTRFLELLTVGHKKRSPTNHHRSFETHFVSNQVHASTSSKGVLPLCERVGCVHISITTITEDPTKEKL